MPDHADRGEICLLQAGGAVFRYLQPSYLLTGAGLLLAGIVVIIAITYSRLYYKKKAYLYHKSIRHSLEIWISEMLLDEPGEPRSIPPQFHRIVKNPLGRTFVIHELINCKKNFSGAAARNIVALYEQLGLKKYSLKKLSSLKWHIKARGIQELYLMDQHDIVKRIYRNTNSKHEFVRMEAQIGLIHLLNFEGLGFLDIASYPITEWQQLKLLSQLGYSKMNLRLYEAIPRWLQSGNATVVLFALKLTDEYQQLALHDPVLQCLLHASEAVRLQAVKTLVRIADEGTAANLVRHFPGETLSVRLAILDGVEKMATEEQVSFLTTLLDDENDLIKLKAAKALAINSGSGLAVLAEKSRQQPLPYEIIYLHIKSDTSL